MLNDSNQIRKMYFSFVAAVTFGCVRFCSFASLFICAASWVKAWIFSGASERGNPVNVIASSVMVKPMRSGVRRVTTSSTVKQSFSTST